MRLFSAAWLTWLLLAGCAQPAVMTDPPAAAPAPALALQSCQFSAAAKSGLGQAQCGFLTVPEDRANPSGKSIRVAVLRIPAASRSPQPDPLFLLAGGPGQAATQAFLPYLGALTAIRQDRDLVLVDQRGTGASSSLACPAADANQALLADFTQAQQVELVRSCLAKIPGDPRFYTTADFIQDLDQIRTALGYARINLLGVSYGTRAALAYLKAFPEHTRSLILDGVAPMGWPIGWDAAADAQAALDAITARCSEDAGCRAAFPDLSQEVTRLFAALDRQPQQVQLPDPTSGTPIQLALTHEKAAETLYTLSYSAQTAALIPLLVHTAATGGDFSRLAAQYLIERGQAQSSVSDGLYLSVVCAEDVPFYPDKPANPAASYLPDGTALLKDECAAWPHARPAASPEVPFRSDVPALLLSGSADPVTPPENAAQAARYLPNSLQVVAPGLGHNVVFQGCLPEVAADFLRRGTAAGMNTACAAAIRPDNFFLNFSGPQP